MDRQIEDYAQQIDRLVDRLDALVEQQNARNHIQVTHTQGGSGPWVIAAVCACFFTMFALIIALIFVVPEIHDLRAWESIYGRDLAAMKQQLQREQKP